MAEIKIVFFDVDGTLYNHHEYKVTESAIKAIKQLKDNGIKVCIATGRPIEMLSQIEEFIDEIEFDYVITSNGQSVYEKGKLIYKNYLDKEDVLSIVNIAHQNNLSVSLVGDDFNVINKLNDLAVLSCNAINFPCPDVVDLKDYINKAIDHLVCYEMIEEQRHFEGQLKKTIMTSWSNRVFDFVPDNGVKVNGIKKVLEHLKLDPGEAMAFGDGNNDIDMIAYVGVGVAMGNAVDSLKEVADEVADTINNDGIFKMLSTYELI